MKKLVYTLAIALGTLTAVAGENDKAATISTKESKVEWVGETVTGKHWGTVGIESGTLNLSGEEVTGGTVVLDMSSLTVDDMEGEYADKLKGHLNSADFFNTAEHKNATFKITKVAEKKGENGNTHVISGDLTIKGITKKVSFPARVTVEGGVVKAFASFSLDRTEWDIKYGSGSFFDDLGDKTIYDEFQVKFNVVANS